MPALKRHGGFALIVTLSLMILLVIVAVGLLSLGSIALRTSGSQDAVNIAKANARMAMMLALGELQKGAGPDQRITMTSSLTESGAAADKGWTGAINVDKNAPSGGDSADLPVMWLVSGDKPGPTTELNDKNSAQLAAIQDKSGGKTEVRALYQNVISGKNKGR